MALRDDSQLEVKPSHTASILHKLDEMRRDEELCDCVLIVGNYLNKFDFVF